MKQFFRTIISVVAISAMTVMFASCAKDELSKEAQKLIPGVERNISASATLPQDADKAHIDGSRKVIWDMGDELNINGTNVAISRIVSGGTVAKFDKSTVHANTVSGTDHYWAVYPTTLAGAYSGGLPTEFTSTSALTVHFPSTQIVDVDAADTLNGFTYMASHAAVASGTEYVHFPMRNLGAVLELDLTSYCINNNNNRVDSIVFTSSNASLAGTFTVSADATNPTITPTAGSNRLVVKFRRYVTLTRSISRKVRVILPPLAGKNLNMRIYSTQYRYMEKDAASITLARNKYYHSSIAVDIITKRNPNLAGFSVALNKGVIFSPGNLQYQAYGSSLDADGNLVGGTWRFAPNQWDYVGNAPGNTTSDSRRSTQTDWIDLFGWGTSGWYSGARAYLPYITTTTSGNYSPGGDYRNNLTGAYAKADWGVYNAIYNPKTGTVDPAGTWRTLTCDEWKYLIETRRMNVNCSSIKMFGHANVNGVNGLVLLPDNWDPALCSSFVYASNIIRSSSYTDNTFSETTTPKWSDMEALGCVFLPAAGSRYWGDVSPDVGLYGRYWTSTRSNGNTIDAYQMGFATDDVSQLGESASHRNAGYSVRLVKDI